MSERETEQNRILFKGRIKILEDDEIEELYGLPRFNTEEQTYYFDLTEGEQEIAISSRTLENQILFILQAGYFKAKTKFFSFELKDVKDDVRQILKQHFPTITDIQLSDTFQKQARHDQQLKIMELHGYRPYTEEERASLLEKASQFVKLSAKPIYLFQSLVHYMDNHKIVLPGYSTMQKIVSQVLISERRRLCEIIENSIDENTKAGLNKLYSNRDVFYDITFLKHEPKDFTPKQLKREINRRKTLADLYHSIKMLIPQFGLSNDSIAYYANLVDYYTVQKLQQMQTGMVYLYLSCYILHRFKKINDNLINAFIYKVHKTMDTSKDLAQVKMLNYQQENNESIRHVSQILSLFLDDNIADHVSFGEIKKKAFSILSPDKLKEVSHYMNNKSLNINAVEWDFIATLSSTFKQNIRPLFMQLTFAGHKGDSTLIEAVEFLKKSFEIGKSLNRYSIDKIPKYFIPQSLKPYIYEYKEKGEKHINPDKYEFLVYVQLRNRIEAGDVYISDSINFRSFEDDLIPIQTWQNNKAKILKEIDIPGLNKPMEELLKDLEKELETKYEEVNQRILSGENTHIKINKQKGDPIWTLPYVRDELNINNPFFDNLPQISIADLLKFVDSRCQCLNSFTHILNRYVKSAIDQQSIIACIVAYGTNVGLGKMGEISDLNYQTLYSASNNFLRLETLHGANDKVSNAIAKLPIFQYYNIDEQIHSSSDAMKLETRLPTIESRHSPKYFGLDKGIADYTLVANHVPINVRIFGANEHESHYVFDVLYNNTTDIKPTIHSTDTHGTNQVNFAILAMFGYQFAPRYKDIRENTDNLVGFKSPGEYNKTFLLKPISKANTRLIIEEKDNILHIFASLALKVTSQSVIIGKLSSYARKNRTKKALWELDNIYDSIYKLNYVDSMTMRRHVQRALNRGESYHKLYRAVAYAYSGKLRVKTNAEQKIWTECSRLLANCVIYYNASILSELLKRNELQGNEKVASQIKKISPISWKHINFYGEYNFSTNSDEIDLNKIVDLIESLNNDLRNNDD